MALVKDVLGPVLEKLEALPEDTEGKDILTFIESRQRYDNVMQLVEKQIQLGGEFNLAVINKLCNFLCDVNLANKNTDAIYFITPNSRANQACLILAECLAIETNSHPYAMLMPPVEAAVPNLTRDNLSEFKLHEFILADDGSVIEVEKCLIDALRAKTLQLRHTHHQTGKLNSNERERIIHHSSLANEFYKSLLNYVIHNKVEYKEPLEAFVDGIRSDDYQVLATYGQEGEARLMNSLLSKIKSNHEFIDLLIANVHRSQWKLFIKKVPTAVLTKIMLEGDPLINSLQRRSNYTGDDYRDRAMLYCFAEVYLRQQQREYSTPFFTGWLPDYVNKYVGNFSSVCLQEACKLLQTFLASNEELSTLRMYAKVMATKEEHYEALFNLFTNLGFFADQVKAITHPDYFKPQQSIMTKVFYYSKY